MSHASGGGNIPQLPVEEQDGGSKPPSNPNPGNPPGGGGGGGGNNTPSPPPPDPCKANPSLCIQHGRGMWSSVKGDFHTIDFGYKYNWSSSVSNACGSDVAGAYISWSTRLTYDPVRGRIVRDTGNYYLTSINCVDFNRYEITRGCITGSDATIQQVVPVSKRIKFATDSSGFLESNRSLNKCENAETAIYLNASLPDFGKYRATANTYRITTVYEVEKDPILDTTKYTYLRTSGSQYRHKGNTRELQVWCDGYAYNWNGNHTFDYTECGKDPHGSDTSNTPVYTCRGDSSIPDVSINGQGRTSASIFRDGNSNPIQWDVFRPTGNFTTTSNGTTRFYRNANGTPWRENGASISRANFVLSLSPNKANQVFTSNTSSGVINGVQNEAYAFGWWASSKNAPTSVYPRWYWNGYSTVDTIHIQSFDGDNFVLGTTSRNIEATASCTGVAADITFLRATQGSS